MTSRVTIRAPGVCLGRQPELGDRTCPRRIMSAPAGPADVVRTNPGGYGSDTVPASQKTLRAPCRRPPASRKDLRKIEYKGCGKKHTPLKNGTTPPYWRGLPSPPSPMRVGPLNPRPPRQCEWGPLNPRPPPPMRVGPVDSTPLPWIDTGLDKREVRERDKGDKGRQESNDI